LPFSPSRILIVRLGAMGDIVHALPVLASLRRRWPDAAIDWLVESKHRGLLEMAPGLHASVVIDSRSIFGTQGWLRVIRTLRQRHYDLVIDAQGLIKSAVLSRSTGSARVVGFDRAHLREPQAALAYTERVDPGTRGHVITKNLALVRHVGVEPVIDCGLAVPEPSAAVRQALGDLGERFVVLNPGAAWPNKRWPPERFGALAAYVHAHHGLSSIVLWGPGERALAEGIVTASACAARVAPETMLRDLVSIVARARLLVSGDTGPLHIAAAVGTPIVGIFGPTRPERNGPWAADDVSVSREDVCECFHARRCHAARWCLDDVSADEVASAVGIRLARLEKVEARS
jgi:lipopolysaccharide heptosyltransferase I